MNASSDTSPWDESREEYDEEALDEYRRKHAWFIGFAPADDPQIAVAVLVENGGGGSSVAAPVVREVLDALQRVSGQKLTIREGERRPGDPPILVAQADRINNVLGWSARYDDLDVIVEHSFNWERNPGY